MADLLGARRANPYRIRAYQRAADAITALPEDIAHVAHRNGLHEIPGIGKDLSDKIREFLTTGSIRAYEELKTPLPEGIASWTTLPGMSESLVSYVYHRLRIESLADLETLVQSHLFRTVPGFTESEDKLLEAIRALRNKQST